MKVGLLVETVGDASKMIRLVNIPSGRDIRNGRACH
jgi:hypothetical protein